jgi:predicted dehydrogenase
MFGDLRLIYSILGHRLNFSVEDTGTIVLKSKSIDTTCVINTGWFSKSVFPDFNFRINVHGTRGYDSTDKYRPIDPRNYAIKAGFQNILRRLVLKKPNYLNYTYYYASYYKILRLFFEALETGSELPISLNKEIDVLSIIENVYNQQRREVNG